MLLWKTEEWGAGVGEQAPLRISEMFINPHQKVSRAENNYRHFKHSLSIVFLLGFILQRVRWRSIALRTLSDRYFPHNPGLLKPAVDAQHTAHGTHCWRHTTLHKVQKTLRKWQVWVFGRCCRQRSILEPTMPEQPQRLLLYSFLTITTESPRCAQLPLSMFSTFTYKLNFVLCGQLDG